MTNYIRRAIWVLCLLTVLAPRSEAQEVTGGNVLAGRVSDELGGVLVDATVEITSLAGDRVATATTDRDGSFRVSLPAAAAFRVVVHHDAFDDAVVDVGAAQLARGEVLDVVLAVGRFVERVSVEAAPREQAFAPQSPQNPYRVPLSAATISQVLTASQIQSLKPVSVFDLLNNTTGAFSTSSGKKGFSGARIRGDSNLVWIVDGAYLPSQVAGRILQALPVNAIEQMEVIRGSSSLTLAPMVGFSNPSGSPTDGFIIIRTKRSQRSNGSARVAFESNATPAANVLAGTTFGKPRTTGARSLGYLSGTVSYLDTAGPDSRLANGHAYNVARHSTSGLVKAGVTQGFFNVDATWFHDHSRFQVPNSALVASTGAADNWEMRPSRTDMLVAAGNLAWSRRQTTLFAISHNRSNQKLNGAGSLANLNFEDGGLLNENRTTHVNLRHVADISGVRVSAGGDLMRWHTPTGQNSYEGIERREQIIGLFSQVERSLLRNRVALDASVRRDQVRVLNGVDYFTGGAQPPQPLPLVTNRLLAPAVFFTAGANAHVTPWLSLLGRVGRNRQSDSNINPAPGVSLEPETQSKWEAGVEGHIGGNLTAMVTAFHRGVQNEKSISGYTYTRNNGTLAVCSTAAVPTTGLTAPATSLQPCYAQSDTTREGLEFVVEGGWAAQGRYRAGFTRMTTLEDSANIVQRTTPRNVFDISLTQGWQLFSVTVSVKRVSLFEGRRPAGGADTAYYPLGDYTRVDSSLGRSFIVGGKAYRLTVYGRNLGDVRYQSVAGFPDVGRVMGTDLTLTF